MKFNLFILTIITSLLISGTSCQKFFYADEIKMTDSLLAKVDKANSMLLTDEQIIKPRRDRVNSILDYINTYYDQEMPLEEQHLLTSYRAVSRAYRDYVRNFDNYMFDNKEHKERLMNLRKDVEAGRIDKADFADIYENETEVINSHLNEIQQMSNVVVSVEPKYHRTKDRVEKIYEDLKNRQEAQSLEN
jgi:hypothetical protein